MTSGASGGGKCPLSTTRRRRSSNTTLCQGVTRESATDQEGVGRDVHPSFFVSSAYTLISNGIDAGVGPLRACGATPGRRRESRVTAYVKLGQTTRSGSLMDRLTKEKRSWNMSRIGPKDTSPELIVRSTLHRLGYRFRLHVKKLPGKPDIVLAKHRTVIFVHGCFWHRHKVYVVNESGTLRPLGLAYT